MARKIPRGIKGEEGSDRKDTFSRVVDARVALSKISTGRDRDWGPGVTEKMAYEGQWCSEERKDNIR